MSVRSVVIKGMAILTAVLSSAACQHKELCLDHIEHAPTYSVDIKAEYMLDWQYDYMGYTDWEVYPGFREEFGFPYDSLSPTRPEGLRLQMYGSDGGSQTYNMASQGEVILMRPGEHSLLLYNNDTEYIEFDAMHSYPSARATTRARTRVTYKGNSLKAENGVSAEEEVTVSAPDMLFCAYLDSYIAERSEETALLPVTMHPLVYTYLIRYEFSHGLEYVSLARGALAGMAESVWLNSGQTSTESATILYDCTVESYGVQATVRSFGAPDFPNDRFTTKSNPGTFCLNLEVRLKNGKILSYEFDVSEQVAAQPQGGIIEVGGIEISDEDGASGGSGFDVNVDDWGEYEDVELIF